MECILIAKNRFSLKIDMKWFGSKYTISESFRRLNLCKINYQHKDIIIPGNHLSENVNTSKVFIMGVSKLIWENILGHIPTFFSLMLKEPCRLGACHFGNPVVTEFWRGGVGQCPCGDFYSVASGVGRKQLWACLRRGRVGDLDPALLFRLLSQSLSLLKEVEKRWKRSQESGAEGQDWRTPRAVLAGPCCLLLGCWVWITCEATLRLTPRLL